MSRLAALALAAALALGLVGCDTSSIVPGGSGDVMPNPAASQTETPPSDGQDAAFQMHFIDVRSVVFCVGIFCTRTIFVRFILIIIFSSIRSFRLFYFFCFGVNL